MIKQKPYEQDIKHLTEYIVFDFETTGLSPLKNEVIEYSFLHYKDNELVAELSNFVKPNSNIPEFIARITGISNRHVSDAKPIHFHLSEIENFISEKVLLGHNVTFDISFLSQMYSNHNRIINIKSLDTLKLAKKHIKDVQNHKLSTLKDFLNIKCVSHRSKEDCIVTNELFKHIKSIV
ncbi:MAG: 3'-5' exonuclease [Anaeroplasmataceae bacterium]